jgi:hypothetical protein
MLVAKPDLFVIGTIILPEPKVLVVMFNAKIGIDVETDIDPKINTHTKTDIDLKINIDKLNFDFPHIRKNFN